MRRRSAPGGETHGKATGVLGIFFDWEGQAQTMVDGLGWYGELVLRQA